MLDIHGQPRKQVWTKVAPPGPRAGDTVFRVSEPVDFAEGEQIVLSVTSEVVTVDSVSGDGLTVTLQTPCVYDHVSSMLPYTNEETGKSWNLDMRTEVALLSRNIVIQGDENSVSQRFGCHTVALHGGHYRIENAEVRHCGQAGNLGRYSTHFHVNGKNPPPYSCVQYTCNPWRPLLCNGGKATHGSAGLCTSLQRQKEWLSLAL